MKYYLRQICSSLVLHQYQKKEKSFILVDNILQDGTVRGCLRMIYHVDLIFSDCFDETEELKNEQINERINERIKQIETFSKFLKDCGGCAVKWHLPDQSN